MRLLQGASSIGVDARMTPLHPPGNSEAGATEQRDSVRPAFSQSAAPLLHAAVIFDAGRPPNNSQRPLSRRAARATSISGEVSGGAAGGPSKQPRRGSDRNRRRRAGAQRRRRSRLPASFQGCGAFGRGEAAMQPASGNGTRRPLSRSGISEAVASVPNRSPAAPTTAGRSFRHRRRWAAGNAGHLAAHGSVGRDQRVQREREHDEQRAGVGVCARPGQDSA